MGSDIEVQWDRDDYNGGYSADVGGLFLEVDDDPMGWRVQWHDDWAGGLAPTLEAAKSAAIACARKVMAETLERLTALEAADDAG